MEEYSLDSRDEEINKYIFYACDCLDTAIVELSKDKADAKLLREKIKYSMTIGKMVQAVVILRDLAADVSLLYDFAERIDRENESQT